MAPERLAPQSTTESEHLVNPIFYSSRWSPRLGQRLDITYYQKYTPTKPVAPERTTTIFGSDRKWRKQMSEYKAIEASRIDLSIGMEEDLLDTSMLTELDDQWRGYTTPELYGESLTNNEFITRIDSLARWINPKAGVNVQQKYQDLAALKAENLVLAAEIEAKYDQQLADLDAEQSVERQRAEAETTDAWDGFNRGINVTAGGVFTKNTISISKTRELSQLDRRLNNLEGSTGLGKQTFSVATALQRMHNPGQFMIDCIGEVDGLQTASGASASAHLMLQEAIRALEVIGEDVELQANVAKCQQDYEIAKQRLRIQSIRFCYIAMVYDRGDLVPSLGNAEAAQESHDNEQLVAAVETIHNAIYPHAPENLGLLANQLISRLYSISAERNNDIVNQEIAHYFATAAKLAVSDMHVDAISRQISERFGEYLII